MDIKEICYICGVNANGYENNKIADCRGDDSPDDGVASCAGRRCLELDAGTELETRRSESHYHHIDFQYVVSGTERFGLLDHSTSYPNCAYKPDVIHYDYDVSTTMFIDSTPERFFLFFPSDWHIAKVATELPSQHIKVVVVKLDYVN